VPASHDFATSAPTPSAPAPTQPNRLCGDDYVGDLFASSATYTPVGVLLAELSAHQFCGSAWC